MPCSKLAGPLVAANFPDCEGDLGIVGVGKCQLCIVAHEPGDHSGVWRLAQRLRDDDVNVEVDQSSRPGLIFRFSRMTTPRSRAAIVVRKARIESGWRLAPGLANFISFGRAFYDNGDGPMFTARQATRQFASLGATPQEQGFGHAGDP